MIFSTDATQRIHQSRMCFAPLADGDTLKKEEASKKKSSVFRMAATATSLQKSTSRICSHSRST